MPFDLNKLINYRKPESFRTDDLVDIKLPYELAAEKAKESQFVIFVVDDDPYLLQAINTQLTDIELVENSRTLKIILQNYATGRSVLRDMDQRPDLIFLNPSVNSGIKNALSGREIINEVMRVNRYQPIVVLGDYDANDVNVLAYPILRSQILGAMGAENQLKEILHSLISN